MKSILLSIALLSAPLLTAQITESETVVHDAQSTADVRDFDATADSDAVSTQDQDDGFDDLMNADVPVGMIEQPKPVSDTEAYLKSIGIQLFMKWIAFRVWLDHLIDSKA